MPSPRIYLFTVFSQGYSLGYSSLMDLKARGPEYSRLPLLTWDLARERPAAVCLDWLGVSCLSRPGIQAPWLTLCSLRSQLLCPPHSPPTPPATSSFLLRLSPINARPNLSTLDQVQLSPAQQACLPGQS